MIDIVPFETHVLKSVFDYGSFSYLICELYEKYLEPKVIETGKHTPVKFREFLGKNGLSFVFNNGRVIVYRK